MRRLAIGIFLLGIAAAAVSLEIYRRPETFQPALVPPSMKVDKTGAEPTIITGGTPAANISAKPATTTTVEEKITAEDYFSTATLKTGDITLGEGRFAASLFRHVPVDVNRDSFSLVLFQFMVDGKGIGTVSRILPAEEMSSGRLLALVRKKLEAVEKTDENDAASITLTPPLKTVGEANFYLNDKARFPDTVFLVARSQGKVLAFQYSTEYHEQVRKIIPLFFQ